MELRNYETRGDIITYREKLLTILNLAGQAIHTSLEYTMGKYLNATDGIYRNETRSDWEVEAVANLLSTNNAAERPFGIAKAYCDIYWLPWPGTVCSTTVPCSTRFFFCVK